MLDWTMKMQLQVKSQMEKQFRKRMQRDFAEFQKRNSRKPTKSELLASFTGNSMLVENAAVTGVSVQDMERRADGVLNDN